MTNFFIGGGTFFQLHVFLPFSYSEIMGDRHKIPRVFASGSQKRKLHAEREKISEETIAKIPKLTNYFTTSNKEQDVSRNTNNKAEDSMRDEDLVNSAQDNSIDAARKSTEPLKIVENQLQTECSRM